MNLSQRLLQTLSLSYFFYTSMPFDVLILIVKIIIIKKKGGSIHNWCHHMVQQSAHRYSALGACIHLLTCLGLSSLLLSVGVNSLAIVVLPTPAQPRPPPQQLCKTGGSWECYLLHGFTTLVTSPSAMLHKWHKIYSTFVLDTSL